MTRENLEGACCVNDGEGNLVGTRAMGRAQRQISDDEYDSWKNAPFPWTADTRVELASVSKVITALILLKMTEFGYVSLDDSIGDALPPFMNYDKYLALGNSDITYRHLIQHRTGWDNDCDELRNIRRVGEYASFFEDPASYVGEEKQCNEGMFSTLGPIDELGNSNYSNANYALLRILIPLLTFPDQASRQEFWQLFDGLSDEDKYKNYGWWTGVGFQKMSWVVYQPAGLGSVTLERDVLTFAAAYPKSIPAGVIPGSALVTTGASGMKQSAAELGLILSALRKGKILQSSFSEMFDPTLGDPNAGRLGWLWQDGGGTSFCHGGDGNAVHHIICYFHGASAVLLTNGGNNYGDWSSKKLWDDVLRLWQISCRDGQTGVSY